jgi:hypothetical protein
MVLEQNKDAGVAGFWCDLQRMPSRQALNGTPELLFQLQRFMYCIPTSLLLSNQTIALLCYVALRYMLHPTRSGNPIRSKREAHRGITPCRFGPSQQARQYFYFATVLFHHAMPSNNKPYSK